MTQIINGIWHDDRGHIIPPPPPAPAVYAAAHTTPVVTRRSQNVSHNPIAAVVIVVIVLLISVALYHAGVAQRHASCVADNAVLGATGTSQALHDQQAADDGC